MFLLPSCSLLRVRNNSMKIIHEKKTIITLAVGAVAVAILYGVSLYIIYQKNNVIVSTEQELVNETENVRRLHDLKRSIKEASKDADLITNYFIDGTNIEASAGFVDYLNSLAKVASVTADIMSPQIATVDKKNKVLTMQINTNGTFGEQYHLLSLLENAPYNILVKQFALTKRSAVGKSTVVLWDGRFNIELSSFVAADKTTQ